MDCLQKIFALQAEAFLKLHKHQDADEAILRGPSFDVDSCTKFLGPVGNANLLLIRAQVDLAAGRFVFRYQAFCKHYSTASSCSITDKTNMLNILVHIRITIKRLKSRNFESLLLQFQRTNLHILVHWLREC